MEVNKMVHKIGMRIQKYRKLLGMSQEELGANLNVSRQTISKWENGDNLPDVYNLISIARLFDVSVDELLLGAPSYGYSKNIIKEIRHKRNRSLLYGRLGLVFVSLLLAPPLVLMDALGVENPTLGIVAASLLTLIGIMTFFIVHFFLKSFRLKEELSYLEKIKSNEVQKEE